MKKAVLWVSVAVAAFAATGCKSDIEKYADDVCECKDKKCLDDVSAKWKDKMPKSDSKDNKELKDMSEKDKEAFGKALACSLKASGFGDK
jgi:hypothetical protein